MAAEWSEGCLWAHGHPYRPVGEPPYDPIGQNLYGTISSEPSYVTGILRWYEEGEYYSYKNLTCSKEPCGHYTQVNLLL